MFYEAGNALDTAVSEQMIIHVERCSESNVNPLLAQFLVSTTA